MPLTFASPYLLPIVLLLGSNMFMTLAWYGPLRFKAVPLIGVIVASWLIAFVEYCAACGGIRADCAGGVLRFSRPAMRHCDHGLRAHARCECANGGGETPFQFFICWS